MKKASKKHLNKNSGNKSTSKISNFFKVTEDRKPIEFVEAGVNIDAIEDPKMYYVGELHKLISTLTEERNVGEENSVSTKEKYDGLRTTNDSNEKSGSHRNEIVTDVSVVAKIVSKSSKKCEQCDKKDKVIEAQKAEIDEGSENWKKLQKKYLELCAYCSELSLKLKLLTNLKDNDHSVLEEQETVVDDLFLPEEIKALLGIALKKKNDSTFVLHCLRYLYKDDTNVLKIKTIRGTPASVGYSEEGELVEIQGKEPLTPKKIKRIRELFVNRLQKCAIDIDEYSERLTRFNSLICSGVKNITKTS